MQRHAKWGQKHTRVCKKLCMPGTGPELDANETKNKPQRLATDL